jgi:urease accessory protein
MSAGAGRPFRVGIGGPVGSGKTALIERLVPLLIAAGESVVVVTNDILTREDELHVKATLAGILPAERIVGVETGTCPHNAVREDPSMNLAVLDELEGRFPDATFAFVESGGDNLTLTFSPELVDWSAYVIDVAGGDKIPRKRGPGLVLADLLVVNKIDLAEHVGADLAVMERDSLAVRDGRPFLFTNCRSGEGVDAVAEALLWARERHAGLLAAGGSLPPAWAPSHDHAHDHGHAYGGHDHLGPAR